MDRSVYPYWATNQFKSITIPHPKKSPFHNRNKQYHPDYSYQIDSAVPSSWDCNGDVQVQGSRMTIANDDVVQIINSLFRIARSVLHIRIYSVRKSFFTIHLLHSPSIFKAITTLIINKIKLENKLFHKYLSSNDLCKKERQ